MVMGMPTAADKAAGIPSLTCMGFLLLAHATRR
jgi:hypothetical protein